MLLEATNPPEIRSRMAVSAFISSSKTTSVLQESKTPVVGFGLVGTKTVSRGWELPSSWISPVTNPITLNGESGVLTETTR